MIDYIPPDIPPAVVEFVHNHNKNLPEEVTGHWFKYLTVWKGNIEVYATQFNFKPLPPDPKTGEKQFRIIGLPTILLYDCHDVRRPTLNEQHDISWFMPKYIVSSKIKSEHLCHRDLEAYNLHNTPNPYKTAKPKYFTPKYIPRSVVEYVNQKFTISWQPGANHRYIKYLTTYENKYEVYLVFWKAPNSDNHSESKYILYDCKNAREYKNNKERIELGSLGASKYESKEKPTFCSSKVK